MTGREVPALVMALLLTATGQTVASPEVLVVELEEVVVTGEYIEGSGSRRRLAASRDQLESSDVTTMEDFFDGIDGLSTLGGDDQGNGFSVDGLSPDLSNVTLNGHGFGEGRGSGGLNAGDLPPEMIRRVDVYKTPTAMLEEGGSGGSVNLQLRNPVEITKPTNGAKGRLSYVPAREKFSPSASYFKGYPAEGRKFGFMLSLSTSERSKAYYSQDITDWILDDFNGRSAYYPGQVRNNAVVDTQRKTFAGITLGFRPRPSLDIGASLFLNRNERDVISHALQHRFERQREIEALSFGGRIVSQLDSSDASRRNMRIVSGTKADKTDSLVLGVNLGWRHAGWRLEGAINYKVDDGGSAMPGSSSIFEANNPFGYALGKDGALVTSYSGGFPDIDEFSASRVNLNRRATRDANGVAALDLARQLGQGFLRRMRFGAKLRNMDRTRTSSKSSIDFAEGQSLDDYFSGNDWRSPWDTVSWPGSDLDKINAYVREQPVEWEENLLNEYDIDRKTLAGYLQLDFRTRGQRQRFLTGNLGLRIVGTKTHIAGYQAEAGQLVPVAVATDYTDLLPGLGARMRLANRMTLSLGAAKVMTHPAFNDLAPGIRLNYADKTGRAGNPGLEPFRADQYTAELTWAPKRGQRLTTYLIYRNIESYFALGEESVVIAGDEFLVTRPINGGDGYIMTAGLRLEQNLQRLNSHLRNLKFLFSYTHNSSSTDMRDPFSGKRLPLPNTAKQVARIELKYSKNALSGKLSYQWRGRSLRASISESGLSVWNEGVGSLNLNFAWRFNGAWQFSLDGRNLLEEKQLRTTDDDTQLWRITERYRSVSATLRLKW